MHKKLSEMTEIAQILQCAWESKTIKVIPRAELCPAAENVNVTKYDNKETLPLIKSIYNRLPLIICYLLDVWPSPAF